MKNILITGTSRGIGKAIKQELENRGYRCIAPTHEELDLNDEKSIAAFLENLDIPIDGLVNNAGINIIGTINSLDDDKISQMVNINLIAPLKLIQHVAVGMKNRHQGKIINVSSIWGVRSKEFRSLYSMTKFGLNGLTRSLARELGEYNILVNSIAPGYVNTEMTQTNVSAQDQERLKQEIPLKRFAEPSEIAKLVEFLLSDSNTYITGETITIDGGFLA